MLIVLQLFQMDFARKLSFLVFVLCVLISLKNRGAETNRVSLDMDLISTVSSSYGSIFLSSKLEESGKNRSLEYDFYRESCPHAEKIIRSMVHILHKVRSDVAPALLRLVFHDCFVGGCDASILLDAADGVDSEKDSPPNESLKGFDLVDIIKSEVEKACPGIVSCADIIVLAAREGVVLGGGPFYPLNTGRRDSTRSFSKMATKELPSPHDDLSRIIESFASRGFHERETVSLLGAHSFGMIHCKFFLNRLYNFNGTGKPDPSVDIEFLEVLRSRCNNSHIPSSPSASPSSTPSALPSSTPSASPSVSPSVSPSSVNGSTFSSSLVDQAMNMDYEGRGSGFGMLYYRSLLQGRGILYADQQLTAGQETETWVRTYASDLPLFRRDFAKAMMKLSELQVLTPPMGQVRLNCSKVT
ncbi:putative Peroxidase 48 [Cornus florida]|uniref:putative Peroxidase 48 n=1 Tax=Cornus florida TaxID=4283 RepID=UPI00289B024D|nr:putative Peroxidase 48 [Cornus florida]